MSAGKLVELEVRPARVVIMANGDEESRVLSFRGAEYHLPKSIVATPLPTLTFRHLEKVTMFAFAGRTDKVVSSVKRAIASAIDTPSLIKIACVAHSEGLLDDARSALSKAVRVAKRDQGLKDIARSVAVHLNCQLD